MPSPKPVERLDYWIIAPRRAQEIGDADSRCGRQRHELEAIYGWNGGQMAALYTREVDRKRLAKQGMDKVVEMNRVRTSIPHLR